MKPALLIALVGLAAAQVAAAKQYSSFRAHTETNASSGPTFSSQVPFLGRTVTLEKVPALSERDVVSFRSYRAADGTFGVLFELSPHGRLALDTLSVDRRGATLFVFVNGRAITELQIDRRITDGKIYLPSGLTANDVALLQKDWPPRRGDR
ncbi:MAG TPA: hypothetical protein VJS88_03010 [Chthoniobacterales bacterium]|nr:hypothetical protein [Chthoniobacterales bacterium]